MTALQIIGYGYAFAVVAYSLLCVSIDPRPDLLAATGFEVVAVSVTLFFALRARRSESGRLQKTVFNGLLDHFLGGTAGVLRATINLVAGVFLAFIALDLAAAMCTRIGAYEVARPLYMVSPLAQAARYVPGMHPAFSAEILAGAAIEGGYRSKAREIFGMLESIRLEFYGERSESYAAFLADRAELSLKDGDLASAERDYLKGLEISLFVLKDRGSGRILTRYADFLRDRGRFAEADKYYLQALEMRQRQFGAHSDKALETLEAYRQLVVQAGQKAPGLKLGTDIAEIDKRIAFEKALKSKRDAKGDPLVYSVFLLVMIALGFVGGRILFGKKGVATRFLLDRLIVKYRSAPESLSEREMQRLRQLLDLTGRSLDE